MTHQREIAMWSSVFLLALLSFAPMAATSGKVHEQDAKAA
jgi:hypothetical protein